jgi:ubiquinone biosynthesis protein
MADLRSGVLSGLFHLVRLTRAGFVLAREGVFALVDPQALPPGPRFLLRCARLIERRNAGSGAARLAIALTRLGPSYVKLGQFLATRPDVVGPAIAKDLETLQDRMAPFSQAEAEAAISEGLGKPVATLF